jgi:hypothetical protein
MVVDFSPSSILGFGVAISLLAYFGGSYLGSPSLVEAAKPFVMLFVGIWVIFIGLTVARNVASSV